LEKGLLPHDVERRNKTIATAGHCLIRKSILHFVLKRKGFEDEVLLYVPSTLRPELVRGAHASRFAGHAGEDKTTLRLRQRYFWPGMGGDVEKFVSTCLTCQKSKTPVAQKHKAPLQPLELPDWPNQRVHMDLMGPLRSHTQNKYVMVMTDAFTKYVVVTPIENKEAKSVAKALFEQWVCKFSVPKLLISDRGKEFCNTVIDELSTFLGVERRMTSAYHPQTNSAAESYNRSFLAYLRAMLDGDSTLDWEEWLPALALSYNTQVHRSTLNSPFYLTFLHPPNLPYFDLHQEVIRYSDSWATEAFLRLQKTYKLVKDNNETAERKSKEYYDKSAREQQFQIGDRVLVFFPRMSRDGNAKMTQPWRPGYVVIKQTSPVSYIVKLTPRSQPMSVHVNRLKLQRDEGHSNLPLAEPKQDRPLPIGSREETLIPQERTERAEDEEEDRDYLLLEEPDAPPDVGQQRAPEPQAQQLGPIDRLAQHVFQPVYEPHRTRSKGAVPDQPRVLDTRQRRPRQ
jgi:hypothetical protein